MSSFTQHHVVFKTCMNVFQTQQKGILKNVVFVQLKSKGFNVVLDPTDFHCMNRNTLKHSSQNLLCSTDERMSYMF